MVDTNGWHTVAAVTYNYLNTSIRAGASWPANFAQAAPDNSASATGVFSDWSLTTGGDGPNLSMQISLTGGSITGPFARPPQSGNVTLPVQACAFPVSVVAKFIPHTGSQTLHDLVLATDQPVTVGTQTGPSPTGNFLADAAFRQLLQDWLKVNLDKFNVLFASVDLDAAYAQAGLAWLKPAYKGYAVIEPPSGATTANSVFAVLCLIDGAAPPSNLAYAVSPQAIPSGATGAFLVSSDKVIQHMLLPAMPLLFEGMANDPPSAHFAIDNAGTRIRNLQDVTVPSVQLDGGTTVEPSITASNFTVQLDVAELQIQVEDMTFESTPGVVIHLNYFGRQTIALDKTKGVLVLNTTQETSDGSVTVTQGLQILEYAMAALSVFSAAASGCGKLVSSAALESIEGSSAVIQGAEAIGEDPEVAQQTTLSALRGLLQGTPAEMAAWASRGKAVAWLGLIGAGLAAVVPAALEILKAVENGEYDKLPQIDDVVNAAVGKTVMWPTVAGGLKLDSAQLAGCLQFGLVKAP